MFGRIYVVNHYVLLHTKYRSCRFMVSKDFFKSYSLLYDKPMEAKDPEGLANLEPRSMIYVGDHQTLLYTKYISSGPNGYGIEDFLIFFPIISLGELLIPMCMTRFHSRGFIGRIYVGDH